MEKGDPANWSENEGEWEYEDTGDHSNMYISFVLLWVYENRDKKEADNYVTECQPVGSVKHNVWCGGDNGV